jgi:hypothetical protein
VGHHVWAWIMHATGSDNVSGPEYGFWSGFAGDITLLFALLTAPFITWRRHNCGVRRCWRLSRHDYQDPESRIVHHLCRRHHPEHPGRPITAAQLQHRYHLYLGDKPGKG